MRRLFTLFFAAAVLPPLASLAQNKVDFVKSIQPLLEANCIDCHGAQKQKGKLRLDTKQSAIPGETGDTIKAGHAEQSELYRRISLPADDEERMPYEAEPLTPAQIALFRDWINQGAVWPEGLVLGLQHRDRSQHFGLPPAPELSDAERLAVAELESARLPVALLARDVGWRTANLSVRGSAVTDATLVAVGRIRSLLQLNLAGTAVTDVGLASLRDLTHLSRLHLGNTRITDVGLAQLSALKNLTSLNLYGTAVTDAGLKHLQALPKLRAVYLWGTATTEDGRTKLRAALPKAEISGGGELIEAPPPLAPTPADKAGAM